jgi:hypothetical protein
MLNPNVRVSQAVTSNTLRLHDRALPEELERRCLEMLDMDIVCDSRLLSKDMLKLVQSFVATTKSILFNEPSCTTNADPDRQPVLRSIGFVIRHARSCRRVSFPMTVLSSTFDWDEEMNIVLTTKLPALVRSCSAVIETIDVDSFYVRGSLAEAAAACPNLRAGGWQDLQDELVPNERRLFALVGSCPKLEELSLLPPEPFCNFPGDVVRPETVLTVLRFGACS